MCIALFPFKNPTTITTEYLGGIDMSICTLSELKCPSITSYCLAIAFAFPLAVFWNRIIDHDSPPCVAKRFKLGGALICSRKCQTLMRFPVKTVAFLRTINVFWSGYHTNLQNAHILYFYKYLPASPVFAMLYQSVKQKGVIEWRNWFRLSSAFLVPKQLYAIALIPLSETLYIEDLIW